VAIVSKGRDIKVDVPTLQTMAFQTNAGLNSRELLGIRFANCRDIKGGCLGFPVDGFSNKRAS
jgi:hypothetical protein